MPEKRNENKIMSMLERTGVLRKVDTEDDSLDTNYSETDRSSDSDIKPLFNTPDESIKVTPAARQPVPGMTTPVFPSERNDETEPERPRVREGAETEWTITEEPPEPESDVFIEPLEFETAPPEPQPQPAAPQRQTPVFSGLNIFKNDNNSEETPAAPARMEREPQSENYTDRYLNTEELYNALALRSKKTESIYLIEEYLQTLPPSLPDSQRREIVGRLISASGFDYDLLMGDGVLRVKMLKEYAERFAQHTEDYIAARQAELDELDQQILRNKRLIENRRELHKKQFFSIEAEAQRLKEILTFISG